MSRVLILGSAPTATKARHWPRDIFDHVVVINNAWRIRADWSHLIHPEDFPPERRPTQLRPEQDIVTAQDYVPAQNIYGGFVYAGGTMAFTAGYWALAALRPTQICYFGCDMVYPKTGNTHFYGSGTADPLRDDVTLADLPAKARRLQYFAATQDCAVVNLNDTTSVLPYPRATLQSLGSARPLRYDRAAADRARALEEDLGYFVPSGRYWQEIDRFSSTALRQVDAAWLQTYASALVAAE